LSVLSGPGSSGRWPAFRSLYQSWFEDIQQAESCRRSSSPDYFISGFTPLATLVRFLGVPESVMYYMTTPATQIPLGPTMSDLSNTILNFSGTTTKLQLPQTCTFDSYTGSQQSCLAYYTGLQEFLTYDGASIDIRFGMSPCQATSGSSDFLGPDLLVDCYGTFCQLLNEVTPCTQTSDCSSYGPGVSCIDWSTGIDSSFDFFYMILIGNSSLPPANTCFGGNLESDFDSLLSAFSGSTITTKMKFCSVNFTYLISSSRNDGFNATQWANQQFVVTGSTAQNTYLKPWPDAGVTAPTTKVPPPGSNLGGSSGSSRIALCVSFIGIVALLLFVSLL